MNVVARLSAGCTLFVTFALGSANAAVIDFETVPLGTPSDQLAISTQYQADFGVTFSLSDGGTPFLERTRNTSGDSGTGFQRNVGGGFDRERAGFEGQLGDYFLRLGTGGLESVPVPVLIITYDTAVSAASAEIWDIDGLSVSNSEQWTVTAHDMSGAVIDTQVSPLGVSAGAGSLDGLPWTWSFDHATADIYSIQIAFTGGRTSNIGLAFDNFSPATAAVVPVPPAFLLFSSALLVLWRQRRLQ